VGARQAPLEAGVLQRRHPRQARPGRRRVPAQAVVELRRTLLETDELSQRLDGFSAQIGQRLIGSGLRPYGELAEAIGDGDSGGAPRPGVFPAPALAELGGYLYCVCQEDGSRNLYMSRFDGELWSAGVLVKDDWPLDRCPGLIALHNRLFIV
jgi:hypothetical protein